MTRARQAARARRRAAALAAACTVGLAGIVSAGAATASGGTGLTAQYFASEKLMNAQLTRTDAAVDFDWGLGSPDPAVPADHFSARWTGQIEPQYSETYTFSTFATDGVRLWVDGRLLISSWESRAPAEDSAQIALVTGRRYDLRLEYFEKSRLAVVRLSWASPSQAKEVVPQRRLYPSGLPASPAPVAPPAPALPPPPPPVSPPAPPVVTLPPTFVPVGPSTGVWSTPTELAGLPATGAAWKALLADADGPLGSASVADQNSDHDVHTLAAALATVRTGRADLRAKATQGLLAAIGTEEGARWLAVGRNVGSYAVAADLLGLRADGDPTSPGSRIQAWLARFLTRTLRHNNSTRLVTLRESAWSSSSNASAQEGFVHASLAAYLGHRSELDWAWLAFRRYAGDRTSPHRLSSNNDAWQAVPADPVGIQNAGATKNGCRLGGAIANDMGRGGTDVCHPGYTQYPWVGLSGAIPAAVVLARAGYPAWPVADGAPRRALEYLWSVRQLTGDAAWFDGRRANAVIHLANRAYGTAFLVSGPVGEDQTIGYTDWTHAPGGASTGGADAG